MMKWISVLLVSQTVFTGSVYAYDCFEEVSKFRSPQEAAQICRNVGGSCYTEYFVFKGWLGAAEGCRDVTSESCYSEAKVFVGWESAADICRRVDERCYKVNRTYNNWRGAAEACNK